MAGYAAIGAAAFNIGEDIGKSITTKKPKAGKPATYFQLPTSYPNDALQNYLSRIYAANIGQQPPSFGEYVASGGTATFPFKDPRMTPNEAAELGFVAPQGGSVPLYTLGQGQLSQEQRLFAAGELFKQHRLRDFPFLHKEFTAHQQLGKRAAGVQQRIDRHPNQTAANAERTKLHDALLAQYFKQTGGHSIA